MFDVMSYADRNDVEVSIRKGHDGRTVWEIFLRDHRLNVTEFTRIIDIEIRGRMDQDAYIEFRCEQLMDMIRSARMKEEYVDIETKRKGLPKIFEPNRRPVGDSLPRLLTTLKTASCQGGLFCLPSCC